MSKDQLEIPGTERPKIRSIENAAQAYVAARDARMSALTKEISAKEKLIMVMQNNSEKLSVNGDGDLVYRYDDEIVVLSEKDMIKVKSVKDEQGKE